MMERRFICSDGGDGYEHKTYPVGTRRAHSTYTGHWMLYLCVGETKRGGPVWRYVGPIATGADAQRWVNDAEPLAQLAMF